jgi:hypothetical protein
MRRSNHERASRLSPRALVVALGILSLASSAYAQPNDAVPEPKPPPPAPAQAPAVALETSTDRTLNGHTFLFPTLQSSAFVTTHFGIRQGLIVVSIPKIPLGADTLDLNASGLIETADLGVKIRPWLGVFGTLGGQVTMGTDVASLIVAGGSFVVNGELGALLRVFRNERTGTQGSLRIGGGLGTGRNVSVLGLVAALVANPEKGAKDVVAGKAGKYILVPTGSRHGTAAFHLAQALTRHLGLQFTLGGQYDYQQARPYSPQEDANVLQSASRAGASAAVAFTLDGAPSRIPVALMVEYSGSLEVHRSEGEKRPFEHVIGAGLYYSGTRDVQIGFAAITQLAASPIQGVDEGGNPAPSGNPSTYAGQFILRHVW